MAFIYLAVWKNGSVYIGQTTTDLARLQKRYASYTSSKRKTKRPSEMACRLHGMPAFRIVETCAPHELDVQEAYWIGAYSCYPNCLNVAARPINVLTLMNIGKNIEMLAEQEARRAERFEARVLELLNGLRPDG